ncbi:MAG: hypothetical protein DRI69_10055 [Bacteroidetes bacterium]|nr:MAG: hypothetical protein DRI69_10055 [Bacteroidota bacterium]
MSDPRADLIDFSEYDKDFLRQVAARLTHQGVSSHHLGRQEVSDTIADVLEDNANLGQILRDADKRLQEQCLTTVQSFLPDKVENFQESLSLSYSQDYPPLKPKEI